MLHVVAFDIHCHSNKSEVENIQYYYNFVKHCALVMGQQIQIVCQVCKLVHVALSIV